MNAQDIVLLLGAGGALLGVLGGAAKWLVLSIDAKTKASEEREEKARAALSKRLEDEITSLKLEMARLQMEKSLYLRRIYQLEHFIHMQKGIDAPSMEGWPPP